MPGLKSLIYQWVTSVSEAIGQHLYLQINFHASPMHFQCITFPMYPRREILQSSIILSAHLIYVYMHVSCFCSKSLDILAMTYFKHTQLTFFKKKTTVRPDQMRLKNWVLSLWMHHLPYRQCQLLDSSFLPKALCKTPCRLADLRLRCELGLEASTCP